MPLQSLSGEEIKEVIAGKKIRIASKNDSSKKKKTPKKTTLNIAEGTA